MIYYSRAINTFEYSCKECGGVCCHLNGGILTFSRDQLTKININVNTKSNVGFYVTMPVFSRKWIDH